MGLSKPTKKKFKKSLEVQCLHLNDVYGGKICAALDRQHPRDLFDIKILFENEGITEGIRKSFVIYLASGNRPIHEILNPKIKNLEASYVSEFMGMTTQKITKEELETARKKLIDLVQKELTNDERQFLFSIKSGEPNWVLIKVKDIEKFPGIQWKLFNINKMDPKKHKQDLEKLKKALHL